MKVIKIGAVWCNGCLVMRPRWKEIEKEHPWLVTEYFDYDLDREKIAGYQVDSVHLPVAIFVDEKNQEIKRLEGEHEKAELVKIITELKDR